VEELSTLNQNGTRLPSHPDRLKTRGVDATTGSLGQGISIAGGMALSHKLAGRPNRVFCIVGDGELNEGQCWEAFQFIAHHRLNNLTVFVDWNKQQLDGELDEIIGVVRAKEMLVALEEGVNVEAVAAASPAIVVPETLDPINLLGVLRRARGSFVIVTNEFGVVQGLVTPLDVLEAIAGEFPDADETPEIVADGEGWLVKGTTDLHALSHTLGLENVINDEEDIATVAGLVIAVNGQIPRVGDVIELSPLHITIVEANDYRVDMVRIVKEQSAHDEDE